MPELGQEAAFSIWLTLSSLAGSFGQKSTPRKKATNKKTIADCLLPRRPKWIEDIKINR